jgi:hypothetical protein
MGLTDQLKLLAKEETKLTNKQRKLRTKARKELKPFTKPMGMTSENGAVTLLYPAPVKRGRRKGH